jgi:hypothetical protein
MRNISDKICVENQNTHVMFNISHENRAIYETMWKGYGIARQTTDDNSLRRWISKVTDTHTEYTSLTTFHGNSDYANALHVMFICTLPVFFSVHLFL